MLIRKNSKLDDLRQALQLKYGDVKGDVDFKERITYTQEGRQEMWTLSHEGTNIEAACLLNGQKVSDFHCTCDQFASKKHCFHLFRVIDLAVKKHEQKLHPTLKRQHYNSLKEDLDYVLTHAKAVDIIDFAKRQAKNFDDFSLLLITAHLQYSKDINEDSHWIRLKSLFSPIRITLKKEAILLKHLQEIKKQLEDLLRLGDIRGASILYVAFARHLMLELFQFPGRDPKILQLKDWFERYPAALIHFKMAPALQNMLRECIRDLISTQLYVAESQLLFYQLPAQWLPEKSVLAAGLKKAVDTDSNLWALPGVYFLYSIFYGIPQHVAIPKEESHVLYWLNVSRYMDPEFNASDVLFKLVIANEKPCQGLLCYLSYYPVGSARVSILANYLNESRCHEVFQKLSREDQDILAAHLKQYNLPKLLYEFCGFYQKEASPSWIDKTNVDHWLYLFPILPDAEAAKLFGELVNAIHDFLDLYLGEINQHRIFQFFERLWCHGKSVIALDLFHDLEHHYPEKNALLASIRSLTGGRNAIDLNF